nr:hypothetical protein [Candidatus Sigynarchaeota archaeon]
MICHSGMKMSCRAVDPLASVDWNSIVPARSGCWLDVIGPPAIDRGRARSG